MRAKDTNETTKRDAVCRQLRVAIEMSESATLDSLLFSRKGAGTEAETRELIVAATRCVALRRAALPSKLACECLTERKRAI